LVKVPNIAVLEYCPLGSVAIRLYAGECIPTVDMAYARPYVGKIVEKFLSCIHQLYDFTHLF